MADQVIDEEPCVTWGAVRWVVGTFGVALLGLAVTLFNAWSEQRDRTTRVEVRQAGTQAELTEFKALVLGYLNRIEGKVDEIARRKHE